MSISLLPTLGTFAHNVTGSTATSGPVEHTNKKICEGQKYILR